MIPADKQWGSLDKNGSWTGIVGVMQRKVALSILLKMMAFDPE